MAMVPLLAFPKVNRSATVYERSIDRRCLFLDSGFAIPGVSTGTREKTMTAKEPVPQKIECPMPTKVEIWVDFRNHRVLARTERKDGFWSGLARSILMAVNFGLSVIRLEREWDLPTQCGELVAHCLREWPAFPNDSIRTSPRSVVSR